MTDMETNEDLERIRDISEKVVLVLKDENADNLEIDMALTRILAAIYSMQPSDLAERLMKLHFRNLKWSVKEIKMNKANLN